VPRRLWVSSDRRTCRQPCAWRVYHSHHRHLQPPRRGEKWQSSGGEQNPAGPRLLARVVAGQGYCAVQQGNVLAM